MSGILHERLLAKDEAEKTRLFVKILDNTVCSICNEYMFIPMMTSCGHDFCYSCLTSWLSGNVTKDLNCPQCRGPITVQPCLNSFLQQCLDMVLESLNDDDDVLDSLRQSKEDSWRRYKRDEDGNELFNDVFKNSGIAVIDEDDDGIARCSNCHWELDPDFDNEDDENVCPHCGTRIRNRMPPRGDSTAGDGFESDEYSEGEITELMHTRTREENQSSSVRHDVLEEDDDLADFIASDDDEDGEQRSLQEHSDRDSDFYDKNDEDGFVTGDSLDNATDSEEEARVNKREEEDDEEEEEEDVGHYRKRRHQVVLDDEE